MNILILILFYILLNTLASILGTIEAILFSGKASNAFNFNEHSLLVLERLFIFLTFMVATLLTPEQVFVLSLLWTLSFSLVHNGSYYFTRSRIDVPEYNFRSNSTTSTAVLEIGWNTRLSLGIVSVIGLIVYLIWFV